MEHVKNKVIVWSIDDFNTLGLMRELGQFDLDLLFLIKGRADFAAQSKYCQEYLEKDTIQEGYDYLMATYRGTLPKPILIIASDEIMTFIDKHKPDMDEVFLMPGAAKQGDTTKFIDKINMTELAEEIGFLCPKSMALQWNTDITGVIYPCLVKPSHQKPGHYNEFKYRICKNEKALKRLLRFVRHDSEFILQQYIPKKLDLLIYGSRMYDGKTVTAGAMIRDRWADSGSSSHGYLTGDIPHCVKEEMISEFLDRIDYHGLFSFEFGMLDDKAYFFEVNLRNDGTSHYFYQAGANIPLAYVYCCAGLDYTAIQTRVDGTKWFIDELFDVENVLKMKISKAEWHKDMDEATVYKYYDINDVEPWRIVKKGRVKQIIQDFVLKRFRIYIVYVLDKFGRGK